MSGYYAHKLSAERLRRCYELAPPRVQRYLSAEIEFALSRVRPTDDVLELGCGYGRVLAHLRGHAGRVVGIDTSCESLRLAADVRGHAPHELHEMDAAHLAFADGSFDVVLCLQNGICVFGVEPGRLVREAVRVTRPEGRVLVSTYAPRFWNHRLEWFQIQSEHGLLGEIDAEATGGGVIVCKDGFRAESMGGDELESLCADLGLRCRLTEVDESSVFCEIRIVHHP